MYIIGRLFGWTPWQSLEKMIVLIIIGKFPNIATGDTGNWINNIEWKLVSPKLLQYIVYTKYYIVLSHNLI